MSESRPHAAKIAWSLLGTLTLLVLTWLLYATSIREETFEVVGSVRSVDRECGMAEGPDGRITDVCGDARVELLLPAEIHFVRLPSSAPLPERSAPVRVRYRRTGLWPISERAVFDTVVEWPATSNP